MNVLILDLFGSFITSDVSNSLKKLGHTIKSIQYILSDKEGNEEFIDYMNNLLKEDVFDLVFSTNYYPVVARVCYENDIVYCSWTYDSPPEIQSFDTLDFSTNRLFFFSRYDYLYFKNVIGIDNVFYLPLGVNVEKYKHFVSEEKYRSDVSLVGGLFHSDSYFGLKSIMTEQQQQYMEAVVAVQMKHSGSIVIDEAITDEFVNQVCEHYRNLSEDAIQPTKPQLFYAICIHITHIERMALLSLGADSKLSTRLYTRKITEEDKDLLLGHGVEILGGVDYASEMPIVFKSCKINLNPTVRANRTGMPLRVLDVLGCGGFLLTTHQEEFDDFFNKDEIATYDSIEEAVEKMKYYSAHESERISVALKGYERVKKDFSFDDRIREMIDKCTMAH